METEDLPANALPDRGDFVQTLAKGLAVIEAFDDQRPAMTLSETARRTGLSRAAARRLLLTLTELGYASFDGKLFSLRPKVLNLGFAYLHSTSVADIAHPFMVELVEKIHESVSASVLDGTDIVYVARVPTQTRIMSISLGPGSRLPAHLTSMGRVLMATLPEPELRTALRAIEPLKPATGYTITDTQALRKRIEQAREEGFAILDQELEVGLRSVAVPIRGARDAVVAALNVGTHAARVSMQDIRQQILPALLQTAARISRAMGARQ